ncbi:MAG: manganese efflux pump MntP family protein, partial [Clostridiales bacterium]|nr:manganese efflux pump MntP family protein [Clostridiales bacterium]
QNISHPEGIYRTPQAYIALALLLYIGIKMIVESVRKQPESETAVFGVGIYSDRNFGNKRSKAEILGGIILIAIGIEMFVKGIIA